MLVAAIQIPHPPVMAKQTRTHLKRSLLRKAQTFMKHLIDIEKEQPYQCEDCRHFKGGIRCAAFDVIPMSIYDNAESHNKVLEGQHGSYVFETDKPRETMRVYEVADI